MQMLTKNGVTMSFENILLFVLILLTSYIKESS